MFHVAATVRFDEKLKTAVPINIEATRDIINMAKEMTKLKSFMHVSSTYANCTDKIIAEKIYPPAVDFKKMSAIVENVPENALDQMTPL